MAQINNIFLLLFVHKKKRLLPAESHSLGQLVLDIGRGTRGEHWSRDATGIETKKQQKTLFFWATGVKQSGSRL
ncbi:MAG: hypothetical protein POH28_02065 [Acidocella sp.]|nr:hypothetical protein [Acidocella sp.]